MPICDFLLRLKPVGQIISVFTASLLPEFMRSMGNLFFETLISVYV